MSAPPRIKSMNFEEMEQRPVFGPAGNKAKSVELKKPVLKLKAEVMQKPFDIYEVKGKKSPESLSTMENGNEKIPSPVASRKNAGGAVSNLRQHQLSFSLNASCSSDASSDSFQSRPSTGGVNSRNATPRTPPSKKKHLYSSKLEKFERMERNGKDSRVEHESSTPDVAIVKKRCAWVTSNTDPSYVAFHDEEWGLPVHDDNKLFELLCFSTALAELTWPVILSKRQLFREVFMDFDPTSVSKLNEKKITTPGSPASSLLSEQKLRGTIENARQICKVRDEFESFEKYIWGFVNMKPIVSNFRYPRQVPIKTSKADIMSKDMVRRGFRGVGPTVVYSFMQAAGLTNDHLISCFRYRDCIISRDLVDKNFDIIPDEEEKLPEDLGKLQLDREI